MLSFTVITVRSRGKIHRSNPSQMRRTKGRPTSSGTSV